MRSFLLLAGVVTLAACTRTSAPVPVKESASPSSGGAPVGSTVAVKGEAPVGKAWQKRVKLPGEASRETPPGLGKARGWLNVTRTPTQSDFAGRVVVLDFWTSCCINCMQTIPTLAALEKKHATDPLLVVGVHTQKFDAEPEPERLRAAVIRLGITHPVAIDGDRGIWEEWGVSAWPTIAVLDAKGKLAWADAGEPDAEMLDAVVETLLAEGAEEKSLATTAPTFLGKEIDPNTPLAFPEKIAKVPGGFAIADSGHDRVVIVDDQGKLLDVVGDGKRGNVDGGFGEARFAHPQGLTAMGDVIYVADEENHEVRAIDRKNKRVTTVAGTGALGEGSLEEGTFDAKTTALRSPWDLVVVKDVLYVALAGSHQIVTLDPDKNRLTLFAGTGAENRMDGPRLQASFAQPSGLATDGKDLFSLDSETSSVRRIDLTTGAVTTLVGKALFVWGDEDGPGKKARLQHPIGLAYGDGYLWVADTYNSKIKRIDAKTGETKTVAGGADHKNFFEPAGLVVMPTNQPGTTLLVADTNDGRIVKLTPKGESVAWPIAGLKAP
jgi:thiol-disulfide isomerase/thioredoxin/DNA-binding beta-propeller fold protein YncE